MLLLLGTQGFVQAKSTKCQQGLNLLYVLEYDGMFDLEPVHLSDPHTAAVVEWALSLSDRLTMDRHAGQDLMVNLPLTRNVEQEL